MKRLIGDIGQWVGLLFGLFGVGVLIWEWESSYRIAFTVACMVWGIATKLKYYDTLAEKNERKKRFPD